MTPSQIASQAAKTALRPWNPFSSGRLLIYLSLALLVLLISAVSLGWWTGDRIATGRAVKADNVQLRTDIADANATIKQQRQTLAESAALLRKYQDTFSAISETVANDRKLTQQQMQQIRSNLEQALAARPDLAGVRVGRSVLDAWIDANLGTARAAAGVPAAATRVRPGTDADRAGNAAAAGGRQRAGPGEKPR